MEMSEEVLQCVGRLEIARHKPVGFLCGTLPVVADAMSFTLPHSALVPPLSQRMAAPRYQMLPTETDLNTLPLLPNIPEKVPHASAKADLRWEPDSFNHNLSRKSEALAVSGLADYGDEINVVAPTDILKQIFKIPYSKAQLSIAVHRVGDCLILNTGPEVEEREKMFSQSETHDPSIFLNFAMHSVRAEACDCPPSHHTASPSKDTAFLPGKLGCGGDNFINSPGQFIGQTVKGTRAGEYLDRRRDDLFWDGKNKPKSKKKDKCREIGKHGFQRVFFWQFHNFRMLLGSDLLVFSNEKYVAVSLHLWDIARQVTPMTWLEAWLDNVMASIPELAICYHRNGVVQGYELLKTDDIFLLKGISEDGSPPFHPQIVQQNGLSVLRFLQDNCKQDPGAYWLYKNAGEDVLQLFNLSVVPESHSPTAHDPDSSLSSLMHTWRRNSLFSLGTILCRVGHRLSLSKFTDENVKCAQFFKKCLDIMCEQNNSVICAHAHEQFARLILNSEEDLDLTAESFHVDVEDSYSSRGWIESSNQPAFRCDNKVFDVPRLLRKEGDLDLSTQRNTDIVESTQVDEISDPVSSKRIAIYHVSQAIKSLRWQRQLQDAGKCIENGDRAHDRSLPSSFSVCACGDTDCIEVCDIQEWLPKSRMDGKMWKLVLLLGESYLALGEAYWDNGQLDQALGVVKLACSLYGSMPQHLEGSHFISSMANNSSLECSSADAPAKCLFWSKAWMLVGDIYVEHYRREKKAVLVREESKEIDSKLCVSEDVIKEVERLKKKLGQSEENCSTCSLINCSCRSDRATSGSSASSSRGTSSSVRKPKTKNWKRQAEGHLEGKTVNPSGTRPCQMPKESGKDSPPSLAGEEGGSTDVPEVKNGGIFRFLGGARVGGVDQNLLAAVACYDAATEAMEGFPTSSAKFHTAVKKTGWAFNELGRVRLDRGDLLGAEVAFADAVRAFKKVSDHTNIILINCNLGHGRRSLAEELVSKMEAVNGLGHGYKQLMRRAKSEYQKSLKYYDAAEAELNDSGDGAEPGLRNEVLTQLAHTYLRLGMLLSREATSRETVNGDIHERSAADAFGHALTLYESLGELRRQEAAFACFHLARFHRDFCLMLLGANQKQGKKARLHADLAENNWNKCLRFYGPSSHPAMYLTVLLEKSMMSSNLSGFFNSYEMSESALECLLEGRHAVGEGTEELLFSEGDRIQGRYRNHLLGLLKGMLSGRSAARSNAISGKEGRLRVMYRVALKSTSLGQLHALHRLWAAPG